MSSPSLKQEFIESIKFAFPIVLTQFGFLGFSIIDLYMVSRIDLIAIGGLGSANSLFWPIFTALMGVIFAIDALAAQRYGADDKHSLHKLLIQGLWLAIILSITALVVFFSVYNYLDIIIDNAKLLHYAKPYYFIVILSAPFLLAFTVLQRYWQARGVSKAILFIVVLANILNFCANEILIFGRFGLPQMGITGAAISTTVSRFFMLAAAMWLTYKNFDRDKPLEIGIDTKILKQMFVLGIPIGLMLLFEVSVFAIATQFTTRISAQATSVHHIGIVLISIFYTIPMGISSAAAYRVGYFVGKNELSYAKKIGYIAILSCAGIMAIISISLYTNATFILGLFTSDPQIIKMGIPILWWITIALTFDGVQCTVAGCLRGGSRTQISSFTTFICHYAVGLPLAYYLCFHYAKNLEGLWMGLASGLIAIAIVLFSYWLFLSADKLKKCEE
ncbi:MATE family efflux transporter [Candidatus Uabimicrobium amorphum]|uniref:Multidrug-efflux transporter n=1 Tax=Uabimicrobium amorphum TaxID=2596890 RepID=A0A5S9ITC5_UABAM|nr:MATE family efflux transporter [Candidatus Uabimicrobium amorphum]BBM87256.1 putative multidrug resistance protein NorM [Candidatus Uabimicrobium amorphum]